MAERGAPIAGFYAIADLAPDAAPAAAAALARDLVAGGARVVQVRMKGAPGGRLLACVRAVAPCCAAAGALLVVNDRLDVALAAGAAGVQLGQDDLPLADARRLAPGLVIGVSTHDLTQARAAAAGGADYIGYGPVFPTATKARPAPVVGLAGLARACAAVPVPVVAIGGITRARVPAVLAAGAAAVAVIGAVVRSGDVRGAAAALAAACRRT